MKITYIEVTKRCHKRCTHNWVLGVKPGSDRGRNNGNLNLTHNFTEHIVPRTHSYKLRFNITVQQAMTPSNRDLNRE